jgi:translation initiation factor IF-2
LRRGAGEAHQAGGSVGRSPGAVRRVSCPRAGGNPPVARFSPARHFPRPGPRRARVPGRQWGRRHVEPRGAGERHPARAGRLTPGSQSPAVRPTSRSAAGGRADERLPRRRDAPPPERGPVCSNAKLDGRAESPRPKPRSAPRTSGAPQGSTRPALEKSSEAARRTTGGNEPAGTMRRHRDERRWGRAARGGQTKALVTLAFSVGSSERGRLPGWRPVAG